MTHQEMSRSYRNLLVVMAREALIKQDEASSIKVAAELETQGGRKSGLYCKANAYAKQAKSLNWMLSKNKAALGHFFQTTELEDVADRDIVLTKNQQSNT